MKTKLPLVLGTACLTTLLSSHLYAAEHKSDDHDDDGHEQEMEQHGSHEHGAARLTVAVTETGLEIALESPAANIFGFEHNAGSDEEHHIVHEAADKLKAGDALFSFDEKADCKLDDADVDSDMIAAHDKEKHGDEEHDNHDHEGEGTHSDVEITWNFKCAQPEQLTQMETAVFAAFPQGFERLNVEWISQDAAGAVELEADGTVKFSQ